MAGLHLFELLVVLEVPHVLVVHAHVIWVQDSTHVSPVQLVPLRRLQQHIDELLSHILVDPLVEKHLLELVLLLRVLLSVATVVRRRRAAWSHATHWIVVHLLGYEMVLVLATGASVVRRMLILWRIH